MNASRDPSEEQKEGSKVRSTVGFLTAALGVLFAWLGVIPPGKAYAGFAPSHPAERTEESAEHHEESPAPPEHVDPEGWSPAVEQELAKKKAVEPEEDTSLRSFALRRHLRGW